MRPDLFCKQVHCTVVIFARNWGNCREKNYVPVENYTTQPCGDQILVLFVVLRFCYLPVNWTGS